MRYKLQKVSRGPLLIEAGSARARAPSARVSYGNLLPAQQPCRSALHSLLRRPAGRTRSRTGHTRRPRCRRVSSNCSTGWCTNALPYHKQLVRSYVILYRQRELAKPCPSATRSSTNTLFAPRQEQQQHRRQHAHPRKRRRHRQQRPHYFPPRSGRAAAARGHPP